MKNGKGRDMNHTEAVEKEAVERYLLGDLSKSESDEFETHFFECTECADELREGALFEENAKAVFREERSAGAGEPRARFEQARASWWTLMWQRPWSAAPALAALALLCVSAYQALLVIPGLRGQLREALSPQAMASYVLPSLSRGEDRALEIARDNRFYALYMDPTWQGSFREYLCSMQDESGSTRFSVHIPAPAPGKPIQILLSRNQLPSGRYTVIVRNAATAGKPESELDRYLLILKLD
jgi:hypothetical protein